MFYELTPKEILVYTVYSLYTVYTYTELDRFIHRVFGDSYYKLLGLVEGNE